MSRLPNEDAMERYFSALLDEPKLEPKVASAISPRVSFSAHLPLEAAPLAPKLQSLLN